MIELKNIENAIFERVQARSPAAENLKIIGVQTKFLNGSLYTVSFEAPAPPPAAAGETLIYTNRAYVRGKQIEIYGFDDQLLAIVGATHDQGWWAYFSKPPFITSLIAISVTILVCAWGFLTMFGKTSGILPEFLSSGFLLILGFYFGKSTRGSDE